MKERPILFSGAMVRALLDGTKTQTRRALKPQPTGFVGGPGVRLLNGAEAPLTPLDETAGPIGREILCPYGQPGDRLWVRETWQFHGGMLDCGTARSAAGTSLYQDIVVSYPADGARVTLHPNGQDWQTPRQPARRKGEEYSLRDAPADFIYDGKNTYYDRLTRWWNRKIPAIHMPRWASRITLEITSVRVERLQDITEADALAEGIVHQPDGGYGLADTTHYHFTDPRQSYFSLWEAINGSGSVDANPWVWAIHFRKVTP